MLSKTEKRWLKARGGIRCKGGYFAFTSDSIMDYVRYRRVLTPDYKDAAEFEARVAESIARDAHNCALDEMMFQHQEGDKPQGWYILRDARLVVEAEMEMEK